MERQINYLLLTAATDNADQQRGLTKTNKRDIKSKLFFSWKNDLISSQTGEFARSPAQWETDGLITGKIKIGGAAPAPVKVCITGQTGLEPLQSFDILWQMLVWSPHLSWHSDGNSLPEWYDKNSAGCRRAFHSSDENLTSSLLNPNSNENKLEICTDRFDFRIKPTEESKRHWERG